MAEEYALTNPEVKPEVVTTKYRIVLVTFNWEAGHIIIHLIKENAPERVYCEYGGPMATEAERDEATKMMRNLNTANLTTKSMNKRMMEKLAADGKLPPGTITGVPDPV